MGTSDLMEIPKDSAVPVDVFEEHFLKNQGLEFRASGVEFRV